MKITSSAFKEGEKIPLLYSCEGKNINPPLTFSDVPVLAKSLVLIMDDPDVPIWVRKDQLYIHWVLYGISAELKEIPESAPQSIGVCGKNSEGGVCYIGPCPPDREHRYFFKLYAIDKAIELPSGMTKERIMQEIEGHIISQAQLMGRYEKAASFLRDRQ